MELGYAVALAAAAVAATFAVALARRYVVGGRSNRALLHWTASLTMFAVASAALAAGEAAGWSPALFRAYYLFGGVLVVPWLAVGTVTTASRDRVTRRLLGVVALVVAALLAVPAAVGDDPELFLTGVVVGAVWGALLLTAPEDGAVAGTLALVGTFTAVASFVVVAAALTGAVPVDRLPEGSELLPAGARSFALAGNAVGATLVIVGALVSAWRLRGRGLPHLVTGNLLIALGVLAAASGGFLAFLGDTASHAVAFAVGVTLMYGGFVRTTRPAGATVSREQPT